MKNAAHILLLLALTAAAQDLDYASSRSAMVTEVQYYATLARDTEIDEDVMHALNTVRRHEFVPQSQRRFAYENRPLPIGHGQTISQPYIVALMTELVHPDSDDVILEIGTGSGYQAAILARF